MSSVIRLFSLTLALALASISANAYAIPRASVDYRWHDVNVRIVEETIPPVASSPRFIARRRGVRDFRFPTPLRTRQALHRPELDDLDVVPDIPMEGRGSVHPHAVPSSSTLSSHTPRDLVLSYADAVPTVLPRNAAGLVQLDLFNTYYQQMHVHSRNLRKSLCSRALYSMLTVSPQEITAAVLVTRETILGFAMKLFGNYEGLGTTWVGLGVSLEILAVTRAWPTTTATTIWKPYLRTSSILIRTPSPLLLTSSTRSLSSAQSSDRVSGLRILQILADSSPGSSVVGELKCIVDEVLNAVENTVDGLLNNLGAVGPWRNLRGDYVNALCGGNLQILGLCVDTNLAGLGLRSA